MNKIKRGVDGFGKCVTVWPFPRVKVCGELTVALTLSLVLKGDLCLPDKQLTIGLVPGAKISIVGRLYVDLMLLRGGVEAVGTL